MEDRCIDLQSGTTGAAQSTGAQRGEIRCRPTALPCWRRVSSLVIGLGGRHLGQWPVGLTALAHGLHQRAALNRRGPDGRKALLFWAGADSTTGMRSEGSAVRRAWSHTGRQCSAQYNRATSRHEHLAILD